MPILTRLRVMAAKTEATIGTAESLTAAEALFNAYDVDVQPAIETEPREDPGTMNNLTGVTGIRKGVARFKTDIWVGLTTHPQWASVLFPACGYVGSTNVYTPRSESPGANVKTITIGVYESNGATAVLKSLVGAVGKFTINLPTGKKGFVDWEFEGVWQPPTDETPIVPVNPTVVPMRFASATCTWGGTNLKVSNVAIESGNEITMREDPTKAGGYVSGLVTSRSPRITADPESVLVATNDRFGQWLANTEAALAFSMAGIGTAAFAVAVPRAQIVNNQEGNRNRLQIDQLEWIANKNVTTKDQEVSITVTPGTA